MSVPDTSSWRVISPDCYQRDVGAIEWTVVRLSGYGRIRTRVWAVRREHGPPLESFSYLRDARGQRRMFATVKAAIKAANIAIVRRQEAIR